MVPVLPGETYLKIIKVTHTVLPGHAQVIVFKKMISTEEHIVECDMNDLSSLMGL